MVGFHIGIYSSNGQRTTWKVYCKSHSWVEREENWILAKVPSIWTQDTTMLKRKSPRIRVSWFKAQPSIYWGTLFDLSVTSIICKIVGKWNPVMTVVHTHPCRISSVCLTPQIPCTLHYPPFCPRRLTSMKFLNRVLPSRILPEGRRARVGYWSHWFTVHGSLSDCLCPPGNLIYTPLSFWVLEIPPFLQPSRPRGVTSPLLQHQGYGTISCGSLPLLSLCQ